MRHVIRVAPLLVVAAALMGLVHPSGCNMRGLATQPNGFSRIETIAHPVAIRTQGLKGFGYINGLNFTNDRWSLIHYSPEGAFTFNDVIPEKFWKCQNNRGCVAVLQVGDEQGILRTPKVGNRLYVCTNDYVQTSDRIHCDSRMIESRSARPPEPGENPDIGYVTPWAHQSMYKALSQTVEGDDFRAWQGDDAQRLFAGRHTFAHSNNSWDPALPGDTSGYWDEYQWRTGPFGASYNEHFIGGGGVYSADIGVCSEFIPWKWEDRDPFGGLNELLGTATGNLGIGEAIVDGMADNPIRQTVYTENAKLWMDALVNVWNRPESAEFHFRVNDKGRRQMCFVQYIAANNKLQTKPDAWFRFDQAFLAGFLELFGIGDCRTHNARIQYCGEIEYNSVTKEASFVVDPSSAKADMEPYSWWKPGCKTFRNKFSSMFPAAIAEPAGEALTENLGRLVSGLPLAIGADIRRIEATPSGLHLVVAETSSDPQYGKGRCTPGLEAAWPSNYRSRGDWSAWAVPATGITRPQ